jgi:hypothetical protein
VTIAAVIAALVLAVAIVWAFTRPNADAPPLAPDIEITMTGLPVPR